MGYSWTLPADGEGGGGQPTCICRTTGPILDPKTAFDNSRIELSEYVARLHLNVTDDVTGRVKDKTFYNLSLLDSPSKVAVSY